MSAYPQPSTYVIATAQSLGANYTSPQIAKEQQQGIYVQAVVTGGTSPTGTWAIQSSADGSAASWNTVTSTSQSITGNGVTSWNLTGQNYKFFRVIYTFTSGSGSAAITANVL